MSEKEIAYIQAIGNRCSIGRVGQREEDTMCFDCDVVTTAEEYIAELQAELSAANSKIEELRITQEAVKIASEENKQLKKAIESFGNGNDFDWNVLDRIDKLEKENNDYEWALDWFAKKFPADYEIMLAEQALKESEKKMIDGN